MRLRLQSFELYGKNDSTNEVCGLIVEAESLSEAFTKGLALLGPGWRVWDMEDQRRRDHELLAESATRLYALVKAIGEGRHEHDGEIKDLCAQFEMEERLTIIGKGDPDKGRMALGGGS